MAYEETEVAVSRSQEQLRKLILQHKGTGVAFISQPPQEGFEATMAIEGATYRIRIMATCNVPAKDKRGWVNSEAKRAALLEQEQRRIWRVIFYHLKSVYEAADSGVMEFREMMLPYVVMPDNRTVAGHIMPRIHEALGGDPSRLLPEFGAN